MKIFKGFSPMKSMKQFYKDSKSKNHHLNDTLSTSRVFSTVILASEVRLREMTQYLTDGEHYRLDVLQVDLIQGPPPSSMLWMSTKHS